MYCKPNKRAAGRRAVLRSWVTDTGPLTQMLGINESVGVGVYDEAVGVSLGEKDSSADLGGSSKYSNENFED